MRKVKFIIAEKSYLIRAGLSKTIQTVKATVISKETQDIEKTIKFTNKYNPDFLIINIKFLKDPHKDIKLLFREKIKTKFILLVGTRRKNEKFEFFDDKICVDDTKTEIINKISELVNSLPNRKVEHDNELSEREKEIVKEIARGKTNKEVADTLCISIHTAKTHRKNITKKLDIKTVSGLTVYAILNNLISIDEAI